MSTRHTRMIAIAFTAACALFTTACVGGSNPAPADTIRTTIDPPSTFDPTKTLSLPDNLLARTSYDTLVRRDDGGLIAGLATDWTATPTQAVLTIRKGATCSDGTAITPGVVKDSLDYFARPDSGSTVPGQVFGGTPPTITADDNAGTVVVDLGAPWPDLMTGLSISSTGIICPAGLADPDGLGGGTAKGSESGPYVLDSFQPGVKYTFTLRDDYDAWPAWATPVDGKPAQTLEYLVSQDSTATANLVMSEQLDIAKIQATTMERFDGMEGYKVSVDRFSDFYLVFNERPSSVLADPALRRGVAQAIDRSMLEKVTSAGTGEIATSLASNLTPCVSTATTTFPEQDAEAASKALDGLSIRFIGPSIAGPAGAGNEYIAEALRAAGAQVTIQNTDVGSWIGTVFGEPDAWDLTLFADLNFLGSLTSPLGSFVGPTIQEGGGNVGGVTNDTADAAFAAALTAPSPEERCGYLNSAVSALVDDVDALPLINDAFIYVQRPGFTVQMRGGSLDDPIFRITD
jgi:peptide/nickel transport system substrate-binding protein